jgi:cytochrome c peroxidase
MRGNLEPAMTGAEIRDHLAARLGNHGGGTGLLASSQWLERFRTAFRSSGSAQELITFDNIALALAEYERSATFTDTPWNRYVRGDDTAISAQAKEGALMFLRTAAEGGAACAQCHTGDTFTDERHHALGFPQIGAGKGDGTSGRDDFGRGRESSLESDRYRFRTPSLLNVELTAPYGHAGTYGDLETVFGHYVVPDIIVGDYLSGAQWCLLPQFQGISDCATIFPAAADLTRTALAKMKADRIAQPTDSMPVIDSVPQSATGPMVQFLQTLTDPCLKNRACFGRWIPGTDEAPDAHQLNAVDAAGRQL